MLWPIFLTALLALSAFALASVRKTRSSVTGKGQPSATQNNLAALNSNRGNYIRRGELWPRLRKNLQVLGDRLEKPGKERMAFAGTVKYAGGPAEIPCELIREFPDRLQLVEHQGINQRITTFSGRSVTSQSFTPAQSNTIETLLFDSVEYFFVSRMEGAATSFLGGRFRLDDGTSPDYNGPFYDIFLVSHQIKMGPAARQRAASYYFDSQSLLLERVRYQQERNGSLVNVEVIMSGWQEIAGQRIPMRVERFENGNSVLRFTFTAAAIGPRVSDNIFGL